MTDYEDLEANLQNYQVQFQQVEAALTTDPNNEELLKLKNDLQEVLTLTQELLLASLNEPSSSRLQQQNRGPHIKWKVGDLCLAPSSEDGKYYQATINELKERARCSVTFLSYGSGGDDIPVMQLKLVDKKPNEPTDVPAKSKKQIIQQQREYKKKKAQKKAQRMKQIEDEREKEKTKWQSFNVKAFTKTHKGQVKKSIFASPDNINGRVGVGTCGIGGKPMTEFHHQEKWRKPGGPGQAAHPPTHPAFP